MQISRNNKITFGCNYCHEASLILRNANIKKPKAKAWIASQVEQVGENENKNHFELAGKMVAMLKKDGIKKLLFP